MFTRVSTAFLLTITLTLALSAPLSAQDLGAQWIDRIGSELRAEKTPGEGGQFTYGAQGGILYAYDSNLFLTEKDRQGDSVWIPYARASVGWSEPQFEADAYLEADYKQYVKTRDARNDEERFFGRIGYSGPFFGASVIQFIRDETDPIDAVFASRMERFVTDTIPRVYVDVTPTLALEAEGTIQVVRFKEDPTLADNRNNENYKGSLTLVWKSQWGIDFLAQGGGFFINYIAKRDANGDPTAPPDVGGWFANGGLRGDLMPDLYVEALAGVIHAQSDDFDLNSKPKRKGFELTTMDASLFVRYKAIDKVVLSAGYSRQVAFGFADDPFQIVNRYQALAEIAAAQGVTVRARAQFDVADSVEGVHRNYATFGVLGTWAVAEHVVLDGGVTLRFGKIYGDVSSNLNYNDGILQVGVGIAW